MKTSPGPWLTEYLYRHAFSYFDGANILDIVSSTKAGVRFRILSFIWHFFLQFVRRNWRFGDGEAKVLCFWNSTNQHSVLGRLVAENWHTVAIPTLDGEDRFPYFLCYLLSIFYLPSALLDYFRLPRNIRNTYPYLANQYLLSYGTYRVARSYFKQRRPAFAMFSNDHTCPPLTIKLAAQSLGIPTGYIQHAPVNDNFPSLDFDYVFLDGLHALNIYDRPGARCKTAFLVGMLKLDELAVSERSQDRVSSISVCLNETSDIDKVTELVDALVALAGAEYVSIRPHPGWLNDFEVIRDLANERGIRFSDSRKESAPDYLKSVDAVISCDSGISLEAAIAEVYPLSYRFGGPYVDQYSYEQNGLIEHFESLPDLLEKLAALQILKPSVRSRARYFNAAIDTSYQGETGKLVIATVNDLIEHREPPQYEYSSGQSIDLIARVR